jgi:hypothetical protein
VCFGLLVELIINAYGHTHNCLLEVKCYYCSGLH